MTPKERAAKLVRLEQGALGSWFAVLPDETCVGSGDMSYAGAVAMRLRHPIEREIEAAVADEREANASLCAAVDDVHGIADALATAIRRGAK